MRLYIASQSDIKGGREEAARILMQLADIDVMESAVTGRWTPAVE